MEKHNYTDEKFEQKVEYLETPIKSANDKKEYRVIKLHNGLIALLISDLECGKIEEIPTGKMAAYGLCIDVGSFSDPIQFQGTAHLLEHTIIHSASKKYPERYKYERLIMSSGGEIRAETSSERTKYLFNEIQPSILLPAMDRIANFLAAPLIDDESVLRELEAVDNEFLLESAVSSERAKRLFRIIPNEDHPASTFSCGNCISLRDDEEDTYLKIRLILMEFWKRHYSAHRMRLVVQAPMTLEILESAVANCFANIPSNNLPVDDFTKHSNLNSINSKNLKKIYRIKPVDNTCEVELKWILPAIQQSYKAKPLNYISRLIEREGKGSLSHYLRDKELCSRVSTKQQLYSFYSTFTLHLVLQDENTPLKNVLEAVFSYVNTLRREGLQENALLFEEMRRMAENRFKYAEGISAAVNVRNLCCDMHLYPSKYYLTGGHLYFEYNPEYIRNLLDCLTPENLFIVHANKKFEEEEFDKIERWYRIKYSVDDIPDNWIANWKEINSTLEFTMPSKNIYIPNDFSLIKLPNDNPKYPVKIKDDGKVKIWYKADGKYRLPYCCVYLRLISMPISNSLNCCVMTRLFEILLHELLLERLYDAKYATSLTYNVTATCAGLLLRVNGFNRKIPVVLKIIVENIAEFDLVITQKLFDIAKSQLLNYYSSVLYHPDALASEILAKTIEPNFWTSNEKKAALLDVNFKQFLTFSKRLTTNLQIESLVQGNVTQDEALKLISISIQILKLSTLHQISNNTTYEKVHHLPIGEINCRVKNFNTSDNNSVVINFYQTNLEYSKFSLPVFQEFLEFLIEEPLFYQLRTIEQLGYEVSFTGSTSGFIISVKSPIKKLSTERVNERIDNFVKQLVDTTLSRMTHDEFNTKKRCFVQSRLTIIDTSLKNEVDRNWFAISCKIPFFDERCPERISAINNLTIDEVRHWLVDRIVVGGKLFRKFSVQVEGNIDNLL